MLEDNSQRAKPETTLNLRGAWKGANVTVYAEVLNLLDEDGKDIVYFYGSHVAGLDPDDELVEGRLSRVEEPRTFRFGIKYTFR